MKEILQCPICEVDLDPHIQVKDFFGTQQTFELRKCPTCELNETSPQPDAKEIVTYYKSGTYVSHGQSKGFLFDRIYQYLQKRNLQYKLSLIRKYSFGSSILDYGAGAGAFSTFMQKYDYQVTAVEPDNEARYLISTDIDSYNTLASVKGTFDIITSYHVLEHVHELLTTLEQFKSILNRNGTIHIALPNYKSHDAEHYKAFWAGYDVPRHLHHFTQKSVQALIKRTGLNLVGTHPLKFDSYYVSLLSEQYKKSKFAPIKAFNQGIKSNRQARKTGEYSSLIYVITN